MYELNKINLQMRSAFLGCCLLICNILILIGNILIQYTYPNRKYTYQELDNAMERARDQYTYVSGISKAKRITPGKEEEIRKIEDAYDYIVQYGKDSLVNR